MCHPRQNVSLSGLQCSLPCTPHHAAAAPSTTAKDLLHCRWHSCRYQCAPMLQTCTFEVAAGRVASQQQLPLLSLPHVGSDVVVVKKIGRVAMPVAVVQIRGDSAAVAQGAVQRHAVRHDAKQWRVLARHCYSNTPTLRLAVIVELSGGTCVATTGGVECGALEHVRVAQLSVPVTEQNNGIQRHADGALERAGVLGA